MLLIGSIGKIKFLPRALCFQAKQESSQLGSIGGVPYRPKYAVNEVFALVSFEGGSDKANRITTSVAAALWGDAPVAASVCEASM
jgi:hypothetical protein